MAGERIFVVDDDITITTHLQRILPKMGYSVLGVVDTGEAAVEQVLQRRPDLVLMDINLKGDMNGIEAAEAIVRRIDMPIIYLTSQDDQELIEKTKNTSPYGYHTKPIRNRDLFAMIEIALNKSRAEERFRSIYSHSPIGIEVYDSRQELLDANPATLALFGVSTFEELKNFNVFLHSSLSLEPFAASSSEKMGNLDLGTNVNREISFQFDEPVHSKSSKAKTGIHFFDCLVTPLRLSGNPQGGYLVHLRDITENKRIEREKALLEIQFQQSQKMEAIGRLAGGVAHDFNNILTVIQGNLSLVLADLSPSDPLCLPLKEAEKASESAAWVTRRLLAFSRKQMIEPKAIDLTDLLENMQRMLIRIIGEDIELQTKGEKGATVVKLDPSQLEQVVVNLAVNARDSMPDGGKLLLEAIPVKLDAAFCQNRSRLEPGEYVLLKVQDTGSGMSDEVKKHLFEPFFTTKSRNKGTGLGLATVYGVVEQSQGHIEVQSDIGLGTTFNMYFPRIRSKPEKVVRPVGGDGIIGGTETILLVEDEPLVRQMGVKMLERLGYRVLDFPNGMAALSGVAERKEPLHLLITDVIMPEMNGRVLATELLKIFPNLKVLFISGYLDDVLGKHGILDEGIHFIGKPYSTKDLAKKIREILDKP